MHQNELSWQKLKLLELKTLILKTLLEIMMFKQSDNCINSIYACVSVDECDAAYTKQRSCFFDTLL